MAQKSITAADILPMADYAKVRAERRRRITGLKQHRRLEVGPFATFYFESFDTMLHQIHEMLFIEKGGAAQLPDELAAYNPLIPQGEELIATLMLEIEDGNRRNATLLTLGGIEEAVFLEIGGDVIRATPTEYDDRTTPDGKTSSVHWLRFRLTADQIVHFKNGIERVVLGVSHKHYGHMAVLGEEARAALVKDFS